MGLWKINKPQPAQLASIAIHKADLVNLTWLSWAKVLDIFAPASRTIGRMAGDLRHQIMRQGPSFEQSNQ